MVPNLNILGEYKVLRNCIVLPMHFVPKDENDGAAKIFEHSATVPSPIQENEEQEVLDRIEAARCGEGAYSKVYRVRIDPNHHRLSQVIKYSSNFVTVKLTGFRIQIACWP